MSVAMARRTFERKMDAAGKANGELGQLRQE